MPAGGSTDGVAALSGGGFMVEWAERERRPLRNITKDPSFNCCRKCRLLQHNCHVFATLKQPFYNFNLKFTTISILLRKYNIGTTIY